MVEQKEARQTIRWQEVRKRKAKVHLKGNQEMRIEEIEYSFLI
jgi:hypothetical protein